MRACMRKTIYRRPYVDLTFPLEFDYHPARSAVLDQHHDRRHACLSILQHWQCLDTTNPKTSMVPHHPIQCLHHWCSGLHGSRPMECNEFARSWKCGIAVFDQCSECIGFWPGYVVVLVLKDVSMMLTLFKWDSYVCLVDPLPTGLGWIGICC